MKEVPAADANHGVVCFGRFVIDVPPGAEVGYSDAEYRFNAVHSELVNYGEREFEQHMEKREAEIKSGKDSSNYRYVKTLSGQKPLPFRIFVSDMEGVITSRISRFEGYVLAGQTLFSMDKEGYGPGRIDSVLSRLQSHVIPRLRVRDANEIPTDPGLCIRDGFIASDGNERANESINISLDFKRWPGLYFNIQASTIHKAEPFLLDRMKKEPVPNIFKPYIRLIKTVREGRHDVGSITGEESLVMLPTDHGYKTHSFTWESHYDLDSPFKPVITVKLNTGLLSESRGKPPTISEKEAVELFDAVVNSIRLRPTGPARTSEAPSPKTPLGMFIRSGEACPQTGWWQCPDGGELEGGNRRFLHAGEAMPRAVTLGAPSLLQRLSGERPRHEAPTVWKLVGYAEEKPPTPDPVSDVPEPMGGPSDA